MVYCIVDICVFHFITFSPPYSHPNCSFVTFLMCINYLKREQGAIDHCFITIILKIHQDHPVLLFFNLKSGFLEYLVVRMQIDHELETTSSDEEKNVEVSTPKSNSICIKLHLGDEKKAKIVYNVLIVDKEPKRSRSSRKIFLEADCIVANITSDDPKSLMKSANNFFEMCQLSKSCIDVVGNYKLKPPATEISTRSKKKTKE